MQIRAVTDAFACLVMEYIRFQLGVLFVAWLLFFLCALCSGFWFVVEVFLNIKLCLIEAFAMFGGCWIDIAWLIFNHCSASAVVFSSLAHPVLRWRAAAGRLRALDAGRRR